MSMAHKALKYERNSCLVNRYAKFSLEGIIRLFQLEKVESLQRVVIDPQAKP